MILLVPHAYLVIIILIIEQLQILKNAHAIVDIMMIVQIKLVRIAIFLGF